MNDKRLNPYVGVTGVRGRKDALDCLGSKPAKKLFENYGTLTMVGVMVGPKTFDLPRPDHSSFPSMEVVRASFTNRRNALNTLHYWHPVGTSDRVFAETLNKLVDESGEHLHAVQFDLSRPSTNVLQSLRGLRSDLRVIIQLGGRHDQDILKTDESLEAWLDEYGSLADDILVDLSGGQGLAMDLGIIPTVLDIISKHSPQVQLAVAGGLDANSVFDLEGLIREDTDLSFDVQGRVRRPKSQGGGLHIPKVHAYQRSALEVLSLASRA